MNTENISRKGAADNELTLFPAAFMTAVCTTYLCIAKIGFNLPVSWNFHIGAGVFVLSLVLFFIWKCRRGIGTK